MLAIYVSSLSLSLCAVLAKVSFKTTCVARADWRMHLKAMAVCASEKRSTAVQETYGSAKEANKWMVYWRLFYLACSELFAMNGGDEYGVLL